MDERKTYAVSGFFKHHVLIIPINKRDEKIVLMIGVIKESYEGEEGAACLFPLFV